MDALKFSDKGKELIKMYQKMAQDGYDRVDQTRVETAFSDFELRVYREQIRPVLNEYSISSILDYGCGGSDWRAPDFDETGQSAVEYFDLQNAYQYEPARDLDERQPVDCVISFDVLEHVFVSDVPNVLRDLFSYSTKLVILNVACYPAGAQLPNGENAHITVRDPAWWKGMVDSISIENPSISVWLIFSTGWRESSAFPIWNADMWQQGSTYVVNT